MIKQKKEPLCETAWSFFRGNLTGGMFIFKTKDPKMQSPIKSCIFSLTEASSQFATNIESLLEENTVLL